MAHGYPASKRYEIAVYAEQSSRSGARCGDPEGIFGDNARETLDLVWYSGTEAELREIAAELLTGGQWSRRAGRAILDYLD